MSLTDPVVLAICSVAFALSAWNSYRPNHGRILEAIRHRESQPVVLVNSNESPDVPVERGLTRTEIARILEKADEENYWEVSPDMYLKYADAILAEADRNRD